MKRGFQYSLCFILSLFFIKNVVAQQANNDSVVAKTKTFENEWADTLSANNSSKALYRIGKIIITGNKKTRSAIILREIPFKEGEEYALASIVKQFEVARRQLLNTSLFTSVIVAAKNFEGLTINVSIELKERWYLYPVPFLSPVDRNLNQWIVEQHANLNRVNAGVRLRYYNATGRNDKLKALVGLGYTKQFSFGYDRLYIDKKMKWGLSVGVAAGKNHELSYNTINNKQAFFKDTANYLQRFFYTTLELTYRQAIKTRHRFGISFIKERIEDTILRLNPGYFKSGLNQISFPEFFYNMSYYDLDYIAYPTKGYAANLSFSKRGINKKINEWQLIAKGSGTWPIATKTYFTLTAFASIKLPFKQSYYGQRLLGYGDAFLQGYEYYVIDGVAGAFIKSTVFRELVNFKIRIPARKGKDPQRIPFRIFGKAYGNAGYADNPIAGENFLSNTLLYSGGFGIDIVTFYDITFKLEYSFNHLGQNGLFLHRKSIF